MAKAVWESVVLASSDQCIAVEGNQYFPPSSIVSEHFEPSPATTVCPWKGTAQYYNVVVNGKRNPNAAWYYADPKPAAREIKGYIGFWKGVKVEL